MAQNEWGRRLEQGEGAVPGPRSFFRALGSGDRARAGVGEKLDFPRLSTAAGFCILGEKRVPRHFWHGHQKASSGNTM
jgi:hypothetical protein